MGKYARIVSTNNPKDPEILINGLGRMKLSQLRKRVLEKAKGLVDFLKDGDYRNADYVTKEGNDMLITGIRALKELEDELSIIQDAMKK